MNVALWLQRAAEARPDAPALLRGERTLATYREFADDVAQVAAGMRARFGVSPGDRVALISPNDPNYLVWLNAIWRAGAIAVPINYKLHPAEIAWIIGDAGVSLVVTTAARAGQLSAACGDHREPPIFTSMDDTDSIRMEGTGSPHECGSDDIAWLFYTSGTTGRPKGVMITHGNLHAMTFAYLADVDTVHSGDAAIYAAPLSHGAGLYSIVHTLKGAQHVVPESGAFDASEILALAKTLRNAHLFAAPTMVNRLVREAEAAGASGDGIRSIIYGGGPMYLADIEHALDVLGSRFIQIYGQGESPMTITVLGRDILNDRSYPRWAARAASVGRPHSCVEVRVVKENGAELPVGEVGEIVVRGAPVMAGYFNNPAATAQTLQDGWLHTGDLGSFDHEGFLTLTDRSKDVIISGGSNIYPREVEEVLLSMRGVTEVSVVGVPDPEWGEAVAAVIVPGQPHPTEEQLDRHCGDHIARFKRPRRYMFVDALPKNAYGKILKTEVRAMLTDQAVSS